MSEPIISDSVKTLESIRSKAHWKTIFHPAYFKKDLISTLAQLRNLIAKCQIGLTGWPFPIYFPEHISCHDDYIEMAVPYSGIVPREDYWKFYQSGQFLHYYVLTEDLTNDLFFVKPIGLESKQEIHIVSYQRIIYFVTQVFLFIKALAKEHIYDQACEIDMGLHNVSGRLLVLTDPNLSGFMSKYICKDTKISYKRKYECKEILMGAEGAAVDASIHFFERFGRNESDSQLPERIQKAFLSRKT